jgi:histidine triad (HIT) family protein
MDIQPVSAGHCLVIPRRHAENLYDISPEDLAAVHRTSQRVISGLRDSLDPLGVAVVQLNGRGVNQVVFHYHVHLIPRGKDEPELRVSHMGAKAGDNQVLKSLAEKIAAALPG